MREKLLQICVLLVFLTHKIEISSDSSNETTTPWIVYEPEIVFEMEGRHVKLKCRGYGLSEKLTWTRDGAEISDPRFNILESGELVIAKLKLNDSGAYICRTEHQYARRERTKILNVKIKTQLREKDSGVSHLEVKSGASVMICFDIVFDPTLKHEFEWFRKPDDAFIQADRISAKDDFCLAIKNATVSDTGIYSCHVYSHANINQMVIDTSVFLKKLIVKDVPNVPTISALQCYQRHATVWWEPNGDNFAPILNYTIEYSTPYLVFWTTIVDSASHMANMYANVALRPGTMYSFRVIAHNEIGRSMPGYILDACQTQSDVPYRNPTNVKIEGTTQTNVVISWTPIPVCEHNAKDFHYLITWKRVDLHGAEWNETRMMWYQGKLIIENQPTFVRYVAIVRAVNEIGFSNETTVENYGYSGEGLPMKAPENLTFIEKYGNWAVLNWNPLPLGTIMGHFKEYTVQISKNHEGKNLIRQINVRDSQATEVAITDLCPNGTNFIRIFVSNGRYKGPDSETIAIEALPLQPQRFQSFRAVLLGAKAALLRWKIQFNEHISGHRLFYREIGANIQSIAGERFIDDENVTQTKVIGLKPNTKYRFYIEALSGDDCTDKRFVELQTKEEGSVQPDSPTFVWQHLKQENGNIAIKVIWMPAADGATGSNFFLKYRIKGESAWTLTHHEEVNDFVIIRQLSPNRLYQIVIVSVDGEFTAEGQMQEITTRAIDSETSYLIPIISIALILAALIVMFICISWRIYHKMHKIQPAPSQIGLPRTIPVATEEPRYI